MERWNSRVALVTGASRGIGAAICTALVKYGINVIGCARSVQMVEELAQKKDIVASPGKLYPVMCDVSKENNIHAMFDEIRSKFGRIDICINNAAIKLRSPITTGRTYDWRNVMEVNVLGMWMCTQEALKLMREKEVDDGVIIQMGSIDGHRILPSYGVIEGLATYNGAKFMNRGLAEALRQELKSCNSSIRVSMISPAVVITDMSARLQAGKEILADVECLQPEDIANAVVHVLKQPDHVNVDDIIVKPKVYEVLADPMPLDISAFAFYH